VISASFVTNRHALLTPALKMAGQIKLDRNSICSAKSICLLNWSESIIPSSTLKANKIPATLNRKQNRTKERWRHEQTTQLAARHQNVHSRVINYQHITSHTQTQTTVYNKYKMILIHNQWSGNDKYS